MPHILMYMVPGGKYSNLRAFLFLVTKLAPSLWFGMVIDIHYPHIHKGKYAPYIEMYGHEVTKVAPSLWFGIHHPHIHNGKYAPYIEVYGPHGPIIVYEEPAFS